jgi:hypothetical protein
MTWQDIAIGLGQCVFVVALVPTILGKEKPPLTTSLPTATVLGMYTFVFLSLSLPFSTIMSLLSAMAWLVIGYQRWHNSRAR